MKCCIISMVSGLKRVMANCVNPSDLGLYLGSSLMYAFTRFSHVHYSEYSEYEILVSFKSYILLEKV